MIFLESRLSRGWQRHIVNGVHSGTELTIRNCVLYRIPYHIHQRQRYFCRSVPRGKVGKKRGKEIRAIVTRSRTRECTAELLEYVVCPSAQALIRVPGQEEAQNVPKNFPLGQRGEIPCHA